MCVCVCVWCVRVCECVCVEGEKGGCCNDNVRTVMLIQRYLQNLSFCATVLRAWMTLGGGPG